MPVTPVASGSKKQHAVVDFAVLAKRTTHLGGVAATHMTLTPAGKALAGELQKTQEGGDGSTASAFHFAPKDLKAALAHKDSRDKLLFDLVVGKTNGAQSEYGDIGTKDVGRKGAFKAMGHIFYGNNGEADQKDFVGTPGRKALDKAMGAFLDGMLGDKNATTVFHVNPGDAGYGGFEGLVAVDAAAGNVFAVVNTWAP